MDVSIIDAEQAEEARMVVSSIENFISGSKRMLFRRGDVSGIELISKAQVEVEYRLYDISDIFFTRLLHRFRKRHPDAVNTVTTDTNIVIPPSMVGKVISDVPKYAIPTNVVRPPSKYILRKITDIADPKNGITYLFKVNYYSEKMKRHDLGLDISYEIPLSADSISRKFEEEKSFTRHKNRWSFNIDGKYRIDFTITTNEDSDPKTGYVVINTTREIEIEQLKDSAISVSNFLTDEIIAEFYNRLLLTRTTYRRDERDTVISMIRDVSVSKPEIMTVDDFLSPDPCVYASTKVDGLRKYLVFTKTGLFLVDPYPHTFISKIVTRSFAVDKESEDPSQSRKIEDPIPGEHFDDYHSMVLDGELVTVKLDGITRKPRQYFIAFDVLKAPGLLFDNEDIEDRLSRVAAISRLFEQKHFKIVRSHLHSYAVTGSFEDYSKSVVIKKVQAMSRQTFYKTDGIVFRSADGKVNRKYKPPTMLSIDLSVKTNWKRDAILSVSCSDQEFDNIISQDETMIVTGRAILLKQGTNKYSGTMIDLNNLPLQEIVVEFVWEKENIFSPYRYRYDKTIPNSLGVVERYLDTIYRYPKGVTYDDIAGHTDLLLQHHITNHILKEAKGLSSVVILGEYFSNFPILRSYKGVPPFEEELEFEKTTLLKEKYPEGVNMIISVVNLDEKIAKAVQRAADAILKPDGVLLVITIDKLALDAIMLYDLIKEMELTDFIIRKVERGYNIRDEKVSPIDCNALIRELTIQSGLTAVDSGYYQNVPTLPMEMQLKGRMLRWLKFRK